MTRPEFITAGRPPRPVRVETRRRWSRGDVHAMGLAAVEDALCRAGGAIDGEARARLLRVRTSAAVEKRDIGCAVLSATEPENRADLSTAGLLAADVSRLIRPATGNFGRDLWGEML